MRIFWIKAVLTSTLAMKLCFAQTTQWRHESVIHLGSSTATVWSKSWQGDTPKLLAELQVTLDAFSQHWLFRERLPSKIGILIDGEWTKTSGYWASNLKTPDGVAAILLAGQTVLNSQEISKLLAHELTHLVHFAARPNEEAWVREGVALLSEYLLTGYFNPVLKEGFLRPETSLLATNDPTQPDYISIQRESAQYGHVLQYFYYVHKLCGRGTLLNKLFEPSKYSGIEALDQVLRSMRDVSEICSSFDRSFHAFQVARFVNSPGAAEKNVFSTTWKATVRKSSAELPAALPPYSAGAYMRSDEQTSCLFGEVAWGQKRCIRIRLR